MDQLGGTPRVFLDPNKLSTDGTVALQGVYFSNNGKYAAYTISRSGSDWQEFYVIDLKTGQLTTDHIEWAKFSGAAWQGDGFYYSAYDAPTQGKEFSNVNEGMKIYYHKIGTPQSDDVLFYQNPAQPKRFYTVSVNEEETMMFLYEDGAGAGNTLFVRDLRKPNSQFIQMTADMDYRYTPLYTEGEKIYLFTNYGAPRNRIMTADINRPGINDWQELIAEQQNVLNNADVINRQLILTYSQDASDHAYLYGLDGRQIREVKLPSVGSVGFTGDEREPECFYTFTSFTVPGTIYRYDLATGESTLYAKPNVKFQQEDYTSEQVFFQSKDGTRIPMFLTYKKNVKSPRPVYLYGYGGFNIALVPSFSANRIPFLEQGGIYAQVTLRGGSEYGEEWHLAGTKMQKQNVFDDFIAAAEWLIREGYTTNEKIAIVGGSNGGLLVGACMTQRPDLFRVAIPQVGVMDMLRYHKFTIGWNWASDYGTSEDSREMFEYLRGYSPLHNLKPGTSYPATLVTTADHDDRVVPAHSFKFAATLQECHKGTNPVLIRIDTKAGHGGGKPLAKILEEQADIYSFILYNMGIKFK
jgi:prolyl oligopeptidase